jgi:hypothetical protein
MTDDASPPPAGSACPTDVCPPPPLVHDFEFVGGLLQLASLVGYVVADYDRGFVGTLGPPLFIFLAWVYLLSAVLAYYARGQLYYGGLSAQRVYPHLASEILNILGALCYCVSTSLYTVKASDDVGVAAAAILCLEYMAAMIGFIGSLVYFRSWEIDEQAADTVGADADTFDAFEPTEQSEDRLFGNMLGGLKRVLRQFFTLDLQSQIWNVVPSLIYLVSAGLGLWLHFVGNPRAIAADAGDTPRLLKLDALRVMSQGYIVADVLFFVDAVIALVAWRYNRSARLLETGDAPIKSLSAPLRDIRL